MYVNSLALKEIAEGSLGFRVYTIVLGGLWKATQIWGMVWTRRFEKEGVALARKPLFLNQFRGIIAGNPKERTFCDCVDTLLAESIQ